MYRILIVEDDPTIAQGLKTHLEKWNYEVFCVMDFKNIIEDFLSFHPHIVFLDIILPFYNGFYWCQEIRKHSNVLIVFLSSANDNMNIVMAMNMGGDEFIEKPFHFDVVTAKVQAVLRRTYELKESIPNGIHWHDAYLNLDDATVTYQDQKVELTKNEFRILEMLWQHAGQIVTRENMMIRLWDSDSFIDDNTLTVNVARLRKKLEQLGLSNVIATKKGIGYMVEL